jgi:hypothetical protein
VTPARRGRDGPVTDVEVGHTAAPSTSVSTLAVLWLCGARTPTPLATLWRSSLGCEKKWWHFESAFALPSDSTDELTSVVRQRVPLHTTAAAPRSAAVGDFRDYQLHTAEADGYSRHRSDQRAGETARRFVPGSLGNPYRTGQDRPSPRMACPSRCFIVIRKVLRSAGVFTYLIRAEGREELVPPRQVLTSAARRSADASELNNWLMKSQRDMLRRFDR